MYKYLSCTIKVYALIETSNNELLENWEIN